VSAAADCCARFVGKASLVEVEATTVQTAEKGETTSASRNKNVLRNRDSVLTNESLGASIAYEQQPTVSTHSYNAPRFLTMTYGAVRCHLSCCSYSKFTD
jgi:hypothetical protein